MSDPSENPLKRLIGEIHRRSLWQVLGIYVVASWVVLQVVEVLQGVMPLPEWFAGLAVGLLLIGLPIVNGLYTAGRSSPSTTSRVRHYDGRVVSRCG